MPAIENLFENNRAWAAAITARNPDFFATLARQQAPQYLWIGCADSRVPANEIVGLLPGEIFVHRNVANLVIHTDLNCLSVLQFAVEVIKVRHVLVVGHYGCGGIQAALKNTRLGLIDNWLRHVQDVRMKHDAIVNAMPEGAVQADCLCELNVVEQVINVCHTTIVQEAWAKGQELCIHGWIYAVQDGLIRDLHMTVSGPSEIASVYDRVLAKFRVGSPPVRSPYR
jgi:carbonic anhydrase